LRVIVNLADDDPGHRLCCTVVRPNKDYEWRENSDQSKNG